MREMGVDLVVQNQNIDTSDATGRFLFKTLGGIGQFETEIRAERQTDGIKRAKDRGVHFGKRPALATEQQVTELRKKTRTGCPDPRPHGGLQPVKGYHLRLPR